jgi:[NiFe] hydrogenase assembly HybE family chaperone
VTDLDLQLDALTLGLERHFRDVQRTRMAGLPILNPALEVKAVGFHRTTAGCLGVLITPWFMNLVLLPCEGDDWQERPIGSGRTYSFPSGSYQFVMAEEKGIGRFQSCSLLSPVLELPDQATALEVAFAALGALVDPRNRDSESNTHAVEIAQRWQAHTDADPDAPDESLSQRPVSRRDLLRGRLPGRPGSAG